MMKTLQPYFLFAISAICITLFVTSCGNNTGTNPAIIYSTVKSQTRWEVDPISNYKISIINYQQFDKNGKITLSRDFSENGKVLDESNFNYDSQTRYEVKKNYNSTGEISSEEKIVYSYDNNRVKNIKVYDKSGNLSSNQSYEYDTFGNVTKVSEIVNSIEKTTEYVNNYNSTGALEVQIKNPSSDGKYSLKDSLVYLPNNNVIEKITINANGTIKQRCATNFDNAGKIKTELYYDSNGRVSKKYVYEYQYY